LNKRPGVRATCRGVLSFRGVYGACAEPREITSTRRERQHGSLAERRTRLGEGPWWPGVAEGLHDMESQIGRERPNLGTAQGPSDANGVFRYVGARQLAS
jgi:hypothetical protein